MAKNKPSRQSSDDDNQPGYDPGQQDIDDDRELEEVITIDPNDIIDLAEFYGDDDSNIRVQLYRKEPTHLDGVRIDGFLQYLTSGTNIGHVENRYGGGLFEIRQLTGNKWSQIKRFRIGGLPKLPAPAEAAAPKAPQPAPESSPNTAPTVPNSITVEGIPIGGTNQEFITMMERLAAVRAMFPPPRDINADLLQLIIAQSNKGSGSGLNIKDISETVSAIKEIAGSLGEGGGGGDWKDLLKEGLGAFKAYLETVRTAPARKPTAMIPANTTQIQSQKAPQITAKQPETRPQEPPEESNDMSIQNIAEKSCAIIVIGYMAEPQQTPEEVNQVLAVRLPKMEPATKELIKGFKDHLYQASRSMLTAEYDVGTEDIEKFRLFFDNTFAIFTGD